MLRLLLRVWIYLRIAPESISDKLNFQKHLGEHAPRSPAYRGHVYMYVTGQPDIYIKERLGERS